MASAASSVSKARPNAVQSAVARDRGRRESQKGQKLLEAGEMSPAIARFQQALQHDPACVPAISGLGEAAFRDGRYDLAEGLFRKALEHAPNDPMLWGWLGTTLNSLRRHDEAQQHLLHARSLGLAIGDIDRGLGIVALAQGRLDEAEAHWRQALATDHLSASVRSMLGGLLLGRGRWLEGWQLRAENPTRSAEKIPRPEWQGIDLSRRDVLLLRNQGLGDELFYLRWLPALQARGAQVVLRCSARLQPLLAGLPGVAELVPEIEGAEVPLRARWQGHPLCALVDDLPLALGDEAASATAPSLRLTPDAAHLARLRARLAALGPAPYIGLTWRAGTAAQADNSHERLIRVAGGGAVRTRPLDKSLPPQALGEALRGVAGTLLALQRQPMPGELEAVAAAAGQPVHDLCDLGHDLAELLALMALLDELVGVSNTNVHLRAAVGRPARVLVPHPSPDWRWMHEGDRSPWFPGSTVYRQTPTGDWSPALERLHADLLSPSPLEIPSAGPSTCASTGLRSTPPRSPAACPDHDLVRQGLDLIATGEHAAAKSHFIGMLQSDPSNAAAVHGLGRVAHAESRYDLALQLLTQAVAAAPARFDWQGDLGLAHLALDDHARALPLLQAAAASEAASADHRRALGFLALQHGDWSGAAAHWQAGLARTPGHRPCSGLLGRWHLARQQWAEGWALVDRLPTRCPAAVSAVLQPWPDAAALRGARVRVVVTEGLGDELFALRFAPALASLGASIDWLAEPKLLPLLRRLPGLDSVIAFEGTEAAVPHGAAEPDYTVLSGHLPRLLWQHSPSPTPPSARVAPLADRLRALEARLIASGPRPWLGLTWQAGQAQPGPAAERTFRGPDGSVIKQRALSKQVPASQFARCTDGLPGTVFLLQRGVDAAAREAFAQACGRPVHDLTDLSEDLEDLLAVMALLDAYAGVCNTNVHLRAMAGRTSEVLVPHPVPEWRWLLEGDESPWFPGCGVHRQRADGDWGPAVARLQRALQSTLQSASNDSTKRLSTGQTLPHAGTTLAADGKAAAGPAVSDVDGVVFWLTHGSISLRDGQPWSELASARLRALLPAAGLAPAGLRSRFLSETGCPESLSGNEPPTPGDTLVIGKSFSHDTTKLLLQSKKQGTRIVVDVCDDHFDHREHGPHLHFLVTAADAVTAATPAMAARIAQASGRDATVIGDPYEGPAGVAHFQPPAAGDARPLRLCWFGHPVNHDTLAAALPAVVALAATRPVHLVAVTHRAQLGPVLQRHTKAAKRGATGAAGVLTTHIEPWTPEAVWQALADCDICLLPTLDGPGKSVRSANRLIEALRAGRCVVAGPHPAHEPFAECAYVGDLAQGLQAALADPAATLARIRSGQERVADTCSPDVVSQAWAQVLQRPAPPAATEALSPAAPSRATTLAVAVPAIPAAAVRYPDPDSPPAPVAATATAASAVRLNLGCGDKILPGYVNVDVVESRAGKRPDVLCDLHRLEPFADDSADEILAVHVVEHFWRWEVLAVLKEWVRVLKPGGLLVLECPNLISACETFLRDPEVAASGGKEGQRSMWVFYGDPQWQDPYMVHRWGYTPKSLAQLMGEAGLVDARQEPAQFKLREPRDMRVVARKPVRLSNAGGIRIVHFK